MLVRNKIRKKQEFALEIIRTNKKYSQTFLQEGPKNIFLKYGKFNTKINLHTDISPGGNNFDVKIKKYIK